MELADAFGQCRRTRLQDVRGLDFIDVPVANRRHAAPSFTLRDLFPPHCLAAPRGDNDVRLTLDDVLGADDALLAEFAVAELGENRIAAGDLDELFDPANARDQRVVPLLEKDPRAAGQLCCGGAYRIEFELEMRNQPIRLVGAADQRAKDANHLQYLGHAALIEDHHRVAALDQLGRDVGLQIGEAEDQVGLERFDLFVFGVDERRDARLASRFRRPHRVTGYADDAVALAEEIQRFRRLLGQAHDARRVAAHNLLTGWQFLRRVADLATRTARG